MFSDEPLVSRSQEQLTPEESYVNCMDWCLLVDKLFCSAVASGCNELLCLLVVISCTVFIYYFCK